ncbi:hypothetical protein SDC9_153921 [bioreactor metagenome]|uniref:Uncharacterized protein n=1 Tax=bioreactor metagenome TaxID=1076179 RepID=A0A645EX88_9ZZZZ
MNVAVLSGFLLLQHLLGLHQSSEIAALVFVQLHLDAANRLRNLWDHNVFQRIDAAPRLLDFIRQPDARLLDLREPHQKRQHLRK